MASSTIAAHSTNIIPRSIAQAARQYGHRFQVSLIPGDGVGREVCHAVKKIFTTALVPVDFDEVTVSGLDCRDESEAECRLQAVLESLRRNRIGLKGTFYTPKEADQHRSYNLAIRKVLDLYANVMHVRPLPGIPRRHPDKPIDMIIIRENTEGEYSNLEHVPVPGVVESLKVTTMAKSLAIHRAAFDLTLRQNRRKITCVHKANIMKMTDGAFLRAFRQVAEEYRHQLGNVELQELIVDNASMQLVMRPDQFDVIVTSNLYGNILGNVCAGLLGSPGLIPGVSFGQGIACFEPGVRHMARDIEGKDVANPIAMILSSVLMLRHLGLDQHAGLIESSLIEVAGRHATDKGVLTPDLVSEGGAKTSHFVNLICNQIEQKIMAPKP